MLPRLRPFKNYLYVAMCSLFIILIAASESFRRFGVPTMEPSFADLRLVTSAASCPPELISVEAGQNCDPWGRAFNYPGIWITLFRALGVTEQNTFTVGLLQIVVYMFALNYWLNTIQLTLINKQSSASIYLLVTVLIFAPPTLLLLERGNVDIIIFVLLTIFFALHSRGRNFAASLVLGLSIALKVFPLALLLFVIMQSRARTFFLCYLPASVLGLALIREDLNQVKERSWLTWNTAMFGMRSLPDVLLLTLGLPSNGYFAEALGLLGLLLLLYAFIIFKSRFPEIELVQIPVDKSKFSIFLFFTIMNGSIFLFPSWDLRLPWLIPLGALLIATQQSVSRQLSVGILFTAIFYLSLGAPSLVLNLVGDLLLYLLMAYLLSVLISKKFFHNNLLEVSN